MKQIIPNIWFNDTSEEAVQFYTTVFKNTRVRGTTHYTDAGKEIHGHKAGDVLTIEFEIEGQGFLALNGGPQFTINPAISFFVYCKTTSEANELWAKLADGGTVRMPLGAYPFSQHYGWVSDTFGVSWQIMVTEGDIAQKIVPSLMFTQNQCGKAEEAMRFYASVFPNSQVGAIARYTAGQEPDKEGTVTHGTFSLNGQQFVAMDSAQAHDFSFNEAVSLIVDCETQDEIDTYWQKLSAVPEAEQCGWLKDAYGVSWQIAPTILQDMLKNGTPQQVERVMAAFMPMKKIDIAQLQRAYSTS